MAESVSSVRNLGPAMEEAFRKVGITSAQQLREIGTDAAYRRLLENGHRPHFIGYYVIEMGLQGRPWNDCKGKEKDALRKRFDEIKSTLRPKPFSGLEKTLNEIGVVERG